MDTIHREQSFELIHMCALSIDIHDVKGEIEKKAVMNACIVSGIVIINTASLTSQSLQSSRETSFALQQMHVYSLYDETFLCNTLLSMRHDYRQGFPNLVPQYPFVVFLLSPCAL